MAYAAVILVAGGIVALIWGGIQKYKAGRISKTPFVQTGQAAGGTGAGPKGEISVQGSVRTGEPLISPVSGAPCLYYELSVEGKWKDGDSTKSKTYVDEKRAARFALDDGSGPVTIDASGGGDFEELKETFDETKKEGLLADLKSVVGKKEPIFFGSYAFDNPAMSKANEFRCIERVLPMTQQLFACGKLEGSAIGSPKWTSLILASKTRDEMLGSAAKNAKTFLMGGAAAAVGGTVIGVISNLM